MWELIVIGGGPAGLSAAWEAYQEGIRDILIIERDCELGGILNQCIHNGFGLHRFREELTGPEYAARYIGMLRETSVQILSDTMVIHLTDEKKVHCISASRGYEILCGKAVILAMGCRERTRGAISIPGSRPSGVFTAGAAQRYLNIDGYLVGKRVVILGSGDIGLIMARRMTLEGAKVLAVVELMPYSNGLTRNIVQCLHDYDIPLYLSHTVTDIQGNARLEKVVVSQVDANGSLVSGTEMEFDCDTLLLSVGLIPENELSREAGIELDPRTGGPIVYDDMQTSVEGIFACGNVLHVHDLVDYVSEEAGKAGRGASRYIKNESESHQDTYCVSAGCGVRYTIPQKIRNLTNDLEIMFRVTAVMERKRISLYCGKDRICTVKRSRLAPAEMEKLRVPAALLGKIDGDLSLVVEDE